MRILLFTGKGGVGKTTTAAATALRLSGRGHKTLVMSADPAHSLAEALGGAAIGDRPTEVVTGLMACQVDALSRMQQHWSSSTSWPAITEQLTASLSAGGLDPIVAEELAVLPGLDDLMILLALNDEISTGLYDVIVVDCAPTGQTLRLLALPEVLDRYLERLYPAHQRILRSLGVLGRTRPSVPGRIRDALAVGLARLHENLAALRHTLTDPDITRIRLVLTPETLALAEARRAACALGLFGYVVDGVIVNRVVDDRDLDLAAMPDWVQAWVTTQRQVLDDVDESFPDLAIRLLGHRGLEPIGAEQLGELADNLYGTGPDGIDPLDGPAPAALTEVLADGPDYLLRLAMPHATAEDLTLHRVGEELSVSVDGHRRLVALPGLLARCRVVNATLAQGVLTVRFEPDPDRWPADLLHSAANDADSNPREPAASRSAPALRGTTRGRRSAE